MAKDINFNEIFHDLFMIFFVCFFSFVILRFYYGLEGFASNSKKSAGPLSVEFS